MIAIIDLYQKELLKVNGFSPSTVLTYCQWECNNVPKMGMKSVPPLLKYGNFSLKGGVTNDFRGGLYGHYCHETIRL